MDNTATDEPKNSPPLGLSLHDQLGPLLEKALVDFGVACRFGDTAARQGTAERIRAAVRAEVAAERERCAVAAWNHYMDICKRRGLPAAMFDDWCAAGAIRGPNVE